MGWSSKGFTTITCSSSRGCGFPPPCFSPPLSARSQRTTVQAAIPLTPSPLTRSYTPSLLPWSSLTWRIPMVTIMRSLPKWPRFEVKKEDYPAAILFIRGKEEGTMEHIKFKGKFTAEELKGFVRKNSGIYMPLVGCSEELDKLADELLAAKKSDMGEVIKKAEGVWDEAKGEKTQKRAEIYVKIMRKIEEVGEGFIAKEETRVKKILTGKVNKEKKEELEERINILKSFSSAKSEDKDEL